MIEKKSDYDKIFHALKKRKEHFGNKQKIKAEYIHIVKEPKTVKCPDSEFDPDFVIRSSLKIAKIVKKTEISSSLIDEAFNRLKEICKIRQ